jgi:hypothetical protein
MKKIIAIASFMVVTALGCYAQDQTPVVDTRQTAQRARIAEGRASGELTRKETARLRGEQRRIRRTERRAKADGTVTPRERARLERKQNRANRDIRRQKHDGQTRP